MLGVNTIRDEGKEIWGRLEKRLGQIVEGVFGGGFQNKSLSINYREIILIDFKNVQLNQYVFVKYQF